MMTWTEVRFHHDFDAALRQKDADATALHWRTRLAKALRRLTVWIER